MGDPRDDTDVLMETEKMLYDLVEEVVDTVATFDGRLTYTPISPDGTCVFTFSTRTAQVHLMIHAHVDKEHGVVISLQGSEGDVTMEQQSIAYRGRFDKTAIRHHLGASLADWYGRAVRHQLHHD